MSRSGAEEAPVRTGAAALGVCVGGLQGQSGALATEEEGRNQSGVAASGALNFPPRKKSGPLGSGLSAKYPIEASWVRCF